MHIITPHSENDRTLSRSTPENDPARLLSLWQCGDQAAMPPQPQSGQIFILLASSIDSISLKFDNNLIHL